MIYSVVVPAYNSEKTIASLVKRLSKVFSELGGEYEIIIVNDGSLDASWRVIEGLCDEEENVVGINLMKNSGQHNALFCGLSFSSGEFVLTLDDDLQNPPEEIPVLVDALREKELDVVYGIPKVKRHSLPRNLGSWLMNLILYRLVGKPKDLRVSNFRIIRRCVVNAVLEYRSEYITLGSLLYQLTNRIENAVVCHEKRPVGNSTYTVSKLVGHFFSNIFNYSTAPLRIMINVGVFFALSAFVYLAVILLQKLTGKIVEPGYASLAVILLFVGGMMLCSIGILGEYIIRILKNSNNHPPFVIREIRKRLD